MRPLSFGTPPRGGEALLDWIVSALQQLEQASQEESERHADGFAVVVDVESRSLSTATATLSDVARALGTFIADQQRRGAFRAE